VKNVLLRRKKNYFHFGFFAAWEKEEIKNRTEKDIHFQGPHKFFSSSLTLFFSSLFLNYSISIHHHSTLLCLSLNVSISICLSVGSSTLFKTLMHFLCFCTFLFAYLCFCIFPIFVLWSLFCSVLIVRVCLYTNSLCLFVTSLLMLLSLI